MANSSKMHLKLILNIFFISYLLEGLRAKTFHIYQILLENSRKSTGILLIGSVEIFLTLLIKFPQNFKSRMNSLFLKDKNIFSSLIKL